MTETHIFIIVLVSAALFRLGGWIWKGFRRYLLPLFLGVMGCLIQYPNINPWIFGAMVGLSLSLHLGYGETKDYAYRFFVSLAWVIPFLVLGFSVWILIIPVLWLLLFKASNWLPIADDFTWAVVELIIGASLGILFLNVL